MIFAKIDPVLSIATQNNLFSQDTQFITASNLVARANKYDLGSEKVSFEIMFGECIYESGSIVDFQHIHSERIELDGDTIANWGTDDSVILQAIATEKGTSVSEILSGSLERFV